MTEKVCRHPDGCDRPPVGLGWCKTHYYRIKRTGDPGPAGLVRRPAGTWTGATCRVEGCQNPVKTAGWCSMHHQRVLTTGEPGPARPLRQPPATATCTIDGCGRPHFARGWCQRHYSRWKSKGDPLAALKRVGKREDADGFRRCSRCNESLPIGQFPGATSAYCKTCQRIKRQERKYGRAITAADVCAICESPDDLVIDHCHASSTTRGVLCRRCNTGLGMFADDPARLVAAARYLGPVGS